MKDLSLSKLTGEKLRYITEDGKPIAVILDMEAFEALKERLEDLEDALDLRDAMESAEGFTSLEELKKDLGSGD